MQRKHLLLFVALSAVALMGCNSVSGTNNNGGNPSIQDAKTPVAADESGDPNLAGMNLADEIQLGSPSILGEASPQAVYPDTARIFWFRHVVTTDRTLNATGDSVLATVTMTRTNTGQFLGGFLQKKDRDHPRAQDGGPGGGPGGGPVHDTLLYNKPFTTTWSRQVELTKLTAVNVETEDSTRWKINRFTLSHTTDAGPAITRVVLIGRDTSGVPFTLEITDPSAWLTPGSLPILSRGDSLKIRVFTDGDLNAAFIHFDLSSSDKGRCNRRPMRWNAIAGAYDGLFIVDRGFGGRGHWEGKRARSAVWVDVISKATIYDTDAAYSATGWGIPYRIRGGKGNGHEHNDNGSSLAAQF